jgi:periplasmic protein CpxP/Spy
MMWRTIFTTAATSLMLPILACTPQLKLEANIIPNEPKLSMTEMIAKSAPPPFDERESPRKRELFEQLELTPEQSEQIEAIEQESRTQAEALHEEMEQNREKMRSLLTANDTTPEQLRQQHQQNQALRQQLDDQRFETMLQVREILTPEQRTQAAELIEQHRPGKRGHHHK